MNSISRRSFVQAGIAATLTANGIGASRQAAAAAPASTRVDFTSDGVVLTPVEYAQLVAHLTTSATTLDEYSRGGPVAELEKRFAGLLGKEAAVFMPSGTLANHLAVRALAGTKRRVAVQQTSHLYNDCGDCAQELSRLTLLPLAPGQATFTWDDVAAEVSRAAGGRVATAIGAISIETPVRRLGHAMFDFAQMQRISTEARKLGIGLHLDGARLFVEAAYAKRELAEYTRLFDTAYVSLWKCFNAGNGAILAGPHALIDDMYQARRMFGGAMRHAWPDALVASHYADGYLARMSAAVGIAEQAWAAIGADPRFRFERVANGTSALRLSVVGVAPEAYQARLSRLGVQLPDAQAGVFTLHVNETAARISAADLAKRFAAALP